MKKKTGKVKEFMYHSESGTFWLAGQTVEILEEDEGESWEPCIVKVQGKNSHGKNETAWINKKDIKI